MLAVTVLGGWLSASPAAALTTCNPTINPPGTPAPGTVVAPGLRVISTQWGLGSCPTSFFVSSRQSDGTIWAIDYNHGLWKSTDDLRTLEKVYTTTQYAGIDQVLPLASGTILIEVHDSNDNYYILRSTDSTGTSFDPTPVLSFPAGSHLHDSNSWTEVGNTVYIGQYAGGPPVSLWTSTDDGRTFSVAWQGDNSDEIHAVQADPYQPGRIWVMVDGAEGGLSGTAVGYSDDGGATFTWVGNGSYPQSRVVDLMFASDAVYWGTDSPEVPGGLFRYDRTTGDVTQLMTNLNSPFYAAVDYNGQLAQFSGVDPSTDGYVGDQNFHVLTNGDGTSWSESTMPWSRDQGDTSLYALPVANTQPDSQGRFWLGYYDLAGSPNLETNIEFQFDPTAHYNGPTSSFTTSPNPFQVGEPTTFDASSSSSPAMPLSYLWNFGDGTSASGAATESHTYTSGGPDTATLQVGDADNNQALSSMVVGSTAQAPAAETGAAQTTSTGATLYGDVTPNGSDASAQFEYGTTSSYGSQTTVQSVGSGFAPETVSATLSNLQPNTTYHYRLDANSSLVASPGVDRVFTTPPSPTSAVTGNASDVTGNTATLNGTVNPEQFETTYYFNYGTTSAYGTSTPPQDAGDGSATEPGSVPVAGLQGNTTYHFQIVAVNESGTFFGPDQTFTTLPSPPTVATSPATYVNSGGAEFNGTVNPNGAATSVYFEYGTTAAYGSQTSLQDAGSGGSASPAVATVSGLQPYTTYHYRLDAVGANGTTFGADQTFSTTAGPPVVTTGNSNGVTTTGATISGTVDPQGQTTTAYFQYGADTTYGSQTANQTLPGNLVANPGCADGTTGSWAADGPAPATFQSQTGWASVGPASCRFTTASLPSGGYSEVYNSSIQSVTAGTQYNLSTDLNVLSIASDQQVVLYVGWLSATGSYLGKTEVVPTSSTGVQTLSGSVTAPADAGSAEVAVTVEGGGTADMYFDNLQMAAAGTGTLQSISAQLSNLQPNTTYHYRAVAVSGTGTSFGPDQTFTTGSPADTTPPTSTASSPATSATATFSVSYQASDNSGGSGLAEVDLYAQAPGQSGYTEVASTTSGAGSGSFGYTATAGGGSYSFYTIATDNAGNVQSTPSAPQTTTTLIVTSTTVTAPATDTKGTAIAASSIGSTLSGARSGATGAITFKVFGPTTTPPATCTSGGTQVGTAVTVSGSGTYRPTAGYTPATAGRYWWYASYSGDASDPASNSGCGAGMTSTAVMNTTTTTATAPGTGTVGTAVPASSINAKLANATTTATGTMTFRVFGPQATPPATCASGGTQVGTPVSISGNGTYHPTASMTPTASGDYWWYASYSGDSSNRPSSSACGAAMAETAVYTRASVASATDTSVDTSTASSSFAVQPNTTYVLLVARHSRSADSITSIASTGLTPALSASSFTLVGSQNYNTADYEWVYDLTTGPGASGTGTVTVTFSKTLPAGGSTILDLVALAGNNLAAPIVTTNKVATHGSSASATTKLPSAPGSLDAEMVFLAAQQDLGAAPTSASAITSAFYSHQATGSADVLFAVPAQRNETLSLSTSVNWGTFGFEIQHG